MARPDRGMAQRYAARRRKRRLTAERTLEAATEQVPAARSVPTSDSAEQIGAPARSGSPRAVFTSAAPRAGSGVSRAAPHRAFSSYASDYAYVAADLRRVVLVAGGLLLVLIVMSLLLH